ncbi:DUF3592 domain-containing protein [Streptomyces sp. NPDC048272]|uniref:DUF3592 domain-containing protein n=1 Tax=Streptomyces sp. NPDC048272 TaxID=3154616 RepID=UPI003434FED6
MSPDQAFWLFALIFISAGAVIAAVAFVKVRQARRLLCHGLSAQGVVVRHERTRIAPGGETTSTSRSSGTTVYYPVIAWTAGDGRTMETRTDVARPKSRTLPVGARVEVRYDFADHSRWTLPAEGQALWWLFLTVGAVFAVVGLGFLVGALTIVPWMPYQGLAPLRPRSVAQLGAAAGRDAHEGGGRPPRP